MRLDLIVRMLEQPADPRVIQLEAYRLALKWWRLEAKSGGELVRWERVMGMAMGLLWASARSGRR